MKKPKPKCEVCGTTKDIFECSWDTRDWFRLCPEDWYAWLMLKPDFIAIARQLELFK